MDSSLAFIQSGQCKVSFSFSTMSRLTVLMRDKWLLVSLWPCDKLSTRPGCDPAFTLRSLGWIPASSRP